jgi:hypothetical protein
MLGVLLKENSLLRTYFPAIYQRLSAASACTRKTAGKSQQPQLLSSRPRSAAPSYQRKLCQSLAIESSISPLTQSAFVPPRDFTFTVTGLGISKALIFYLDLCCEQFLSLLLIQRYSTLVSSHLTLLSLSIASLVVRWFRRYRIRLHLFFARRIHSSLLIQCSYRCHRSRVILFTFRQQESSLRIQCIWRQHLSRKARLHLKHTKAAIKLQAIVRGYLAQRLRAHLYQVSKVTLIQQWVRVVLFRWKTKACSKIIRSALRLLTPPMDHHLPLTERL